MKIDSRKKFNDFARRGLCGNTPRMWALEEYVQLSDTETCPTVFITSVDTDVLKLYFQTRKEVKDLFQSRVSATRIVHPYQPEVFVDVDDIIVMETLPIEKQKRVSVFQGEYMHEERYLRCIISANSWGCCKRLGFEAHINGFKAQYTLRNWMGPQAQHLFEVAEAWPDHIIEFTNFAHNMGIWDTRPLIWEVRTY
jgi:hypothetical protein